MEISAGYGRPERKVGFVTSLGFLFGLSVALTAYLGSSYYKQATGIEGVGIFYLISFVFILLILLNLHKIFLAFGRSRTLLFLLFAQVVVVFLLSIIEVSPLGAFFLMMYYVLYGTIWVVWDSVLEAYSDDERTGRIRGLFLSVWGVGAVIGPLLALTLLGSFSEDYRVIFKLVLVLYTVMLTMALVTLNDIRSPMDTKRFSHKQMMRRFLATDAIWKVYWVAIALSFSASVLVIFVPLRLIELGFEWSQMGLMFTIMLLPYMLLEYPAGVLADKKLGEKEIMILGFVILIAAIMIIAFLDSQSFVLWTLVLVLSRVGYALIESMRDSYFYKQIDGKDVGVINFFRTARPIGYIIATAIATVIQILFGMQAIFFMLVGVLVLSLYPAVFLKDTK